MTVSQLIEILQRFPSDAPVTCYPSEDYTKRFDKQYHVESVRDLDGGTVVIQYLEIDPTI